MVGLLYPGVCRLDYDASVEGGVFPSAIESCSAPEVARWLERVIKVLPVAPAAGRLRAAGGPEPRPGVDCTAGEIGTVLLGGDPGNGRGRTG